MSLFILVSCKKCKIFFVSQSYYCCFAKIFLFCFVPACICNIQHVILFSLDGSEGSYDEETELFKQECDDFMKEFVAKIFLEE